MLYKRVFMESVRDLSLQKQRLETKRVLNMFRSKHV